jgi:hypothetical protein
LIVAPTRDQRVIPTFANIPFAKERLGVVVPALKAIGTVAAHDERLEAIARD